MGVEAVRVDTDGKGWYIVVDEVANDNRSDDADRLDSVNDDEAAVLNWSEVELVREEEEELNWFVVDVELKLESYLHEELVAADAGLLLLKLVTLISMGFPLEHNRPLIICKSPWFL